MSAWTPSMTKPKPQFEVPVEVPKIAEPTCGNCKFWREYDDDMNALPEEGACYFNPPLVKLEKDGGEIVHRPTLLRDEFACGRFFPRN